MYVWHIITHKIDSDVEQKTLYLTVPLVEKASSGCSYTSLVCPSHFPNVSYPGPSSILSKSRVPKPPYSFHISAPGLSFIYTLLLSFHFVGDFCSKKLGYGQGLFGQGFEIRYRHDRYSKLSERRPSQHTETRQRFPRAHGPRTPLT